MIDLILCAALPLSNIWISVYMNLKNHLIEPNIISDRKLAFQPTRTISTFLCLRYQLFQLAACIRASFCDKKKLIPKLLPH